MESERYKKFLEIESRKAPIKRKKSEVRERFWIYWEERTDGSELRKKGESDIIDSLYFGKDPQKTVVIDGKVARIIQDRLKGLEEENIRLRKHVKIMKLIIAALISITFILAMITFIRMGTFFY